MYRDYNCPFYKKFRKQVLARDKWRCRWPKCKIRKRLQIHHIRMWSENPWIRFHIDNGITLCKQHHDSIKGKETYFAEYLMRIVKNV